MSTITLFSRFGFALMMGILVGIQREYAYDDRHYELFAGIRTFSLLALAGCLAAFISDIFNNIWVFAVIALVFCVLILIAYTVSAIRGQVGMTSEVAALITVLVGAVVFWGYLELAAAITVVTTVLLSLKSELQKFADQITREDVYATLKFAVITAIFLPVFPNQSIGSPPFDVLNPYKIWLMVVFISGISFLGYVLIKFVGPKQGIGLTGLLGGLVSSTAVTLSFAQRSQKQPILAKPFALAIMVAWTVMFSRVFLEVGVVNRSLLGVLWKPLTASAVVGIGYALYLFYSQRTNEQGNMTFSNPFELRPAVTFGVLYAVILVVSKAAQMYLGGAGIYLSSILAGLTDVDAITLSMAQLSYPVGNLEQELAARGVVLAAMSNTAVKGGIAIITGSKKLRQALLPGFILMFVVGIAVAFLL